MSGILFDAIFDSVDEKDLQQFYAGVLYYELMLLIIYDLILF